MQALLLTMPLIPEHEPNRKWCPAKPEHFIHSKMWKWFWKDCIQISKWHVEDS